MTGGGQAGEQSWTEGMGCSQGHLQRHLQMLVKVCLLCLLALCFCVWFFDVAARSTGQAGAFLKSLGLPLKHAGQRAGTLNGLLKRGGKTGRLVATKLKSKAGRKPWVARKDTFRDICQCL